MTANHWQIVLIISSFVAQLIAPALAEFVRSRINQPKPTPHPKQPKNVIQKMGGWLTHFLTSPPQRFKRLQIVALVSPFVAVLFPIYVLREYLPNPAPATRPVVFLISMCVTAIWFSFFNFLVNVSLHFVWQAISDTTKQSGQLVDIVLRLRDKVDTLAETQSAMSKTLELTQPSQEAGPDQSTPGVLSKLGAAVKGLFGG